MQYSYVGRAPIYGGVRKIDVDVIRENTKIGDRIEGGTVVGKYRNFVLVRRRSGCREAIRWVDLLTGLYKPKDLEEIKL